MISSVSGTHGPEANTCQERKVPDYLLPIIFVITNKVVVFNCFCVMYIH